VELDKKEDYYSLVLEIRIYPFFERDIFEVHSLIRRLYVVGSPLLSGRFQVQVLVGGPRFVVSVGLKV